MGKSSLSPAMLWTLRLLALAACLLSGYLLVASMQSEGVVGCGWSSFDCDAALASPYAKLFGVPVAVGGLICYAAALVASFLVGGKSQGAATAGWRILELVTPLAVGAGLWFIAVQVFSLGSFCLYCVLTHACGLAIAVIAVLLRRSADQSPGGAPMNLMGIGAAENAPPEGPAPPPSLGVPTVIGLLSVVLMIGAQMLAPPADPVEYAADQLPDDFRMEFNEEAGDKEDEPETAAASQASEPTVTETPVADEPDSQLATYEAEATEPSPTKPKIEVPGRKRGGSRRVEMLNGQFIIDTYKHPIIGSPEAPHIVVELMDYACPHCREFHEIMLEALDRFEGQIAVVVFPVPGDRLCNPYVKKARPQSRGACRIAKLSMAVAQESPNGFPDFHHMLLQGDKMPQYTTALIEAQQHVRSEKLSNVMLDIDGELASRLKRYISLMGALYKQNSKFGLPSQILPNKVQVGPAESLDSLCQSWADSFGLETPTVDLPFE